MRRRIVSQINIRAPYRFAFHNLPRPYAGDGIIGQNMSVDALALEEPEMLGNPEVPVLETKLASVRVQIGRIGWEYVQEDAKVGICQ